MELLSGFEFSDSEIAAVPQGRLLSMELEVTRACNYRCPYCYVGDFQVQNELSFGEMTDALRQAKELGARKIILLGGEPFLYRRLFELVDFIGGLGMRTEIFTNGSLITEENAKLLLEKNVRVVVKFNSLDPELHDRLTASKGSLANTLRAFKLLRKAGYADRERMLGGSSVITTENFDEIPEMWKFLREKKIQPYFECLTPQGRLMENRGLIPEPERVGALFEKLSAYDRARGLDWEPQPPLAGGKCFRHRYSCLVGSMGNVFPCVGISEKLGNIRETPLGELLAESLTLRKLRDYRRWIKPPCRDCDRADRCYGCRGAAWQTTGDYLAADPTCWKNASKLSEIQSLPVRTENLVPHRPPVAVPGVLTRILDRGGILEFTPEKDSLFADPETGILAEEALPEIAAQSIAAFDSFLRNGAVKKGMLAEINRFESLRPVRTGRKYKLEFKTESDMPPWHIVSFRIAEEENDEPAAEGELKLCVPEEN